MHLLTKIRGWTQSSPMGNDKQNPWLGAAAIVAIAKLAKAGAKAHRNRLARNAQAGAIARKKSRGLRDIKEKKQISPEQAAGMQKLRRGTQRGMIDVSGQTQQIGQEQYQRGEAQEAQAIGQLTAQGLEGSIMAQDVSSRIDAGTRAATAEQARQIAFKNQQSKQQAEQKLQEQLFKRRGLLEDLAFKKRAVEEGASEEQIASDFAFRQNRRQTNEAAWSAGYDFLATGATEELGWDPEKT